MDTLPLSLEGLRTFQPAIIFVASAVWVYVSLTRMRTFDKNPAAKALLSLCMGFFCLTSVQMTHWETLISIASWAIPFGLAGTMLYRAAFQRGRTEVEEDRRWEERKWRTERK